MKSSILAQLKREVAPYEKPNTAASLWQIANTVIPFLLIWYAAYVSLSVSIWLALALAVLNAGFVVRMFTLLHDCSHYSFFRSRMANEWCGQILGFLIFVPYQSFKQDHAIHHASNGNLNKRGTGDVQLWTVEEYLNASWRGRIGYRLYRNPWVLFVLGPLYLFLVAYRRPKKGADERKNTNIRLTNLVILCICFILCWEIGWAAFLVIQGTTIWLSGAIGIWLFYVQHQFEHSYFEREGEWDYVRAALEGSSFYKLPAVLQWFTGNIGYHHIHHLSSKIPNYYLAEVQQRTPAFQCVAPITMTSSLASLRYRLWDERNKCFVHFRDIQHLIALSKYGQKDVGLLY